MYYFGEKPPEYEIEEYLDISNLDEEQQEALLAEIENLNPEDFFDVMLFSYKNKLHISLVGVVDEDTYDELSDIFRYYYLKE